jgi:transcriptional regulator with XRE-family HTH domain
MAAPGRNTKGGSDLVTPPAPASVDTPGAFGQVVPVPVPRSAPWDPDAAGDDDPILALDGEGSTQESAERAAVQKATRRAKREGSPVLGTGGRAKERRRKLILTQQALALRATGLSTVEVAKALGVSPHTVTGWLTAHRRTLAAGEIDALLDEIAVPLAAENLVHGLIAGDKDYTLETLKGRGQLKRHTAGDEKPTGALPALSIVFEAPVSIGGQQLNAAGSPTRGTILGTASAPTQDQTVASGVGGADIDALDTVPVPVLPSAHADLPPAPVAHRPAPLVLGVGQPTGRVVERGSGEGVPGSADPVLP